MVNKKLAAVSICFCLIGFVLALVSLNADNWVFFEIREDER